MDELGSFSESCGEMKRAVGRGPVVEGPLLFFRMGCGIGAGALDVVDDDVVLGRLWSGKWHLKLQDRGDHFFSKNPKFSTMWLMRAKRLIPIVGFPHRDSQVLVVVQSSGRPRCAQITAQQSHHSTLVSDFPIYATSNFPNVRL